MEIIRHGNDRKSNDLKRFVCSNCECEFIADNTEYSKCDLEYDGSEEYIANCPECGAVVSSDDKIFHTLLHIW